MSRFNERMDPVAFEQARQRAQKKVAKITEGLIPLPSPQADGYCDNTVKPSNPKDLIGSNKIPVHLWPTTATVFGAMALLDGALKYGRSNFRAVGVRASIYYDALWRHMAAWFEGENHDPDSGLPHLAHALACIAILVEAQVKGNMTDDRMFPTEYRALLTGMTPLVEELKAKYAGKDPHHYTIEDSR